MGRKRIETMNTAAAEKLGENVHRGSVRKDGKLHAFIVRADRWFDARRTVMAAYGVGPEDVFFGSVEGVSVLEIRRFDTRYVGSPLHNTLRFEWREAGTERWHGASA